MPQENVVFVRPNITLNDVIMVTGIIRIRTTRINGIQDILAKKLMGYRILRPPPPQRGLHRTYHHPPTEHLLNLIKQDYWIIHYRQAVRSVKFKCN